MGLNDNLRNQTSEQLEQRCIKIGKLEGDFNPSQFLYLEYATSSVARVEPYTKKRSRTFCLQARILRLTPISLSDKIDCACEVKAKPALFMRNHSMFYYSDVAYIWQGVSSMKSAIILSGYAALQGVSIVPDAKYPVTAHHLKKMLEGTGQFRVEVVEELFPRVLESGELFDLDLLVLNFPRHLYEHIPRLPDAQEQGFSRFVRSGKGVVAIHASNNAFPEWQEYKKIIGGVWGKHSRIDFGVGRSFTVNIEDAMHPITKGMKDFVIDDELYTGLNLESNIQVLASAFSQFSGSQQPVAWTQTYGDGRVFHNVLGHHPPSTQNPHFIQLTVNGALWAATKEFK